MNSYAGKTICVMALLTLATPVHALKLVTVENPPFAYTDPASKKLVGVSANMVEEAARRAKLPYSTEIVPWARANSLARSDADTCIYPLARTPEREALFRWVGPLSNNKWVLFARSNFSGTINSLADVEKYKVGGLLEDGPSLFLKSKGIDVDLVGDNASNARKLSVGRLDLWATGIARGKILANEIGFKDIKVAYTIMEIDHFLACNPTVAEDVIGNLNQAVKAMWQDGTMKKISERYP